MWTVDKFLMFELETGGQFWAWLGIIVNSIFMVLLLLAFFFLNSIDCDDILTFLKELNAEEGLTVDNCQKLHTGFKGFLIITIILLIVGLILLFLLVTGIKKRNHCQILPAAIAQGIDAVLLLIFAPFSGSIGSFVTITIVGAIWFYMFIVLISLYKKIKDEKRGTYNAQYVHP
ncbi:uncharacterized protein [Chironomus tepperi]|uniref:uncharacterized protein n=1 Tax=Chironomus tepperi TaxID=113505 RepID=UPI00391F581A